MMRYYPRVMSLFHFTRGVLQILPLESLIRTPFYGQTGRCQGDVEGQLGRSLQPKTAFHRPGVWTLETWPPKSCFRFSLQLEGRVTGLTSSG
eukprot:jgi/Botrbrau1/16374/Bobra.0245s0006.1